MTPIFYATGRFLIKNMCNFTAAMSFWIGFSGLCFVRLYEGGLTGLVRHYPEVGVGMFAMNDSFVRKMKRQILFIINPISGTGRKRTIPSDIVQYLDHGHFDYEIKFTERAGHATELAHEAARCGVNVVCAVGGDGTVNEVARAVVHTETALAIIPCGSGNGLARHLQIPQNPRRAIEIINRDVVHCLDYGKINGQPFFCTCGMGFDAFVSMKFANSGRRGLVQYARNTIGVGFSYKGDTYTIESEQGTETVDAFLIACANASQYGNNAYIAPAASMKDGLMDVVIMQPINPIEGAQVLLQMFTKTLLNNSHVRMLKSKRVRITRRSGGAVHLDGEPLMMGNEIEVEMVPHSFNVIVNPDAHSKRHNYLQDMAERIGDLFRTEYAPVREEHQEEDSFNLERFVKAGDDCYERALDEVRNGHKRTHWMWYVFPQMSGLGMSAASRHYGISGAAEAEAFLAHPILGQRLYEITEALLALDRACSAHEVFGSPDDLKLQSCMTLFSSISEEGNVFERILSRYFDGQPCFRTLQLLYGKAEKEPV